MLEAVAEGRLGPAEAAEALAALDTTGDADAAGQAVPLRRLRIVAGRRHVVVVADPAVGQAVADGPHQAHRDGATLVFECPDDPSPEAGPGVASTFVSAVSGAVRAAVHSSHQPTSALAVRANPALDLDIEMEVGTLVVRRSRAATRARVGTGTVRVEDFSGPIDIDVGTGTVDATGTLTEGDSRVGVRTGKARVRLGPGSRVRASVAVTLGRATVGGRAGHHPLDNRQDLVLGDGRASLSITVGTGKAHLEPPP